VKRAACLLAGIAAMSSAAALAAHDGASGQQTAFEPPAGPVKLTRVLRRDLSDGKAIILTRSYRLEFTRRDQGYLVSAVATEVGIDAPPALAALARIELEREDAAFSLELDESGLIVAEQASDSTTTRAMLAARGEALIASAISNASQRTQALAMFSQLAQATGGTSLPRDFFNPQSPESREQRALSLPDGSQGQIEILLRAERSTTGALPQRVSREVITTLGTSRQTSREDYVLAPG
jgi:hypothetical protein